MEGINWVALLPVIIPSVTTITLAIVAFILKMKKDSMTGMSKELSELVLTIVEAAKDRKFTQKEITDIITEAQDVIREAKKLVGSE